MLAVALIVFRETIEAGLIVGIVLAATRGLVGRERWVLTGVAAGLAGACLVAAFAGSIASFMEGMGQELFNAMILLLAVVLLGWHNVWMERHGREMANQLRLVGHSVIAGTRPLYVLAIVVGLAILREGSEVVLLLYGIAAGGGSGATGMLAGGGIGLAGGAALSAALYLGLLVIPLRYLFNVTAALILLVAGGLAAQAAKFLVQARVLPPLGQPLWDSSWLLSDNTVAGQILHALVGYAARPSGAQLAFYLATLMAIGGLMYLNRRQRVAVANTGTTQRTSTQEQ
jgi:high-affinity iron transporter